jgi:hemolysin activation/secretion protein
MATAEYRFHVPRIFAIQADPTKTPFLWDKSFRAAPQHPYGRPDWDLILRGFVDVAEVVNSARQPFEKDATLVGTGVGMELQYKQNFNVRVDWGAALTDLPDEVRAGSNRFHISSTILY